MAGNGDGIGGTKHLYSALELSNFADKARDLVTKIDSDLREPMRAIIKKPKLDKKRKSKKDDGFDYSLNQTVHLRLNYDRYGVIIRDELLVKSAADRWNAAAGEITRALLEVALVDESKLKDDASVDVGLNQITEGYTKEKLSALQSGIIGAPSKQTVDLIKEFLGVMSGDDRTDRMANAFLGNEGSYFHLEFAAVAVKLRASLMMDLVRTHLGGKEARVLATVAKAQRITEQTVSRCFCMSICLTGLPSED
jgi:DNA-directed RNA polymerase III subunit RPC3